MRVGDGRLTAMVALALVLTMTAGCVTAQPKLPKTSLVSSRSAYLGGIFTKTESSLVRFGFGVRNVWTGQEVVMKFEAGEVSLIELPPGIYRVRYWQTWGWSGAVMMREEFSKDTAIGRPFELKAGEIVLLGNLVADYTTGFARLTFTIVSHPVRTEDSIALVAAYPGFATAPIHCLICQ